VARRATSTPTLNITLGVEQIKLIPSKRAREVIIVLGNESTTQR
jgi:hypothetical protein